MPSVTHLAVSHEPALFPSQSSGPSGFPTRISTNLVAVVFQVSFVTPSLVPSVTLTGLGSAVNDARGFATTAEVDVAFGLDFPQPTSDKAIVTAGRNIGTRRLWPTLRETIAGRDYSGSNGGACTGGSAPF
jgi:hypothetical protein